MQNGTDELICELKLPAPEWLVEGAGAGKWCGIPIYSNTGSLRDRFSFWKLIEDFVSFIPILCN
jgi:hypothetical protein